MGYMYAIISSIFFSLYALPKKFARMKPHHYVINMGFSSLIISIVFFLFLGINENFWSEWLYLSLFGGLIWFIASALFFYSIDKIGVARATEFKSLQGPIGSLLILIILKEFVSLNLYILLLAIIFIFLSAISLIVKEDKKPKIKFSSISLALLSAFLYAINGFIRKVVTMQNLVYSQQIYSAIGIILGALVYMLFKDKKINGDIFRKRNSIIAMLSGTFYYFASFFMLLAYKYMEGSLAFTIIQLNAVWTAIIGIFIFKEIDYKKYYKRIILSLLLAFLGLYTLMKY